MKKPEEISENFILRQFRELEARIERIEQKLNLESPESGLPDSDPLFSHNISDSADSLELRIGQYWFARSGFVVLSLGIVFLLTLSYRGFPVFTPSLVGYLIAALLLLFSHIGRNVFSYLSHYFLGGGMVLLYFSTLRLHFFGESRVLENISLETLFLMLTVGLNFVISVKKSSAFLSLLTLFLGYVTAIISSSALLLFVIITILSLLSVYLKNKLNWNSVFIFSIVLTYFTHFIWFLNNPFLGNRMMLVSQPDSNILFLMSYTLIFALGNLFTFKEEKENSGLIWSTFLISVLGYGLFLLVTLTKFNTHLVLYHFLASILFLILAVSFWIRAEAKYTTFFYAILGYSALSVSILAYFDRPDSFFWLCLQSLIVISTAIWFRSKIIVLANFIIFLIIFLAFLIMAGNSGWISLNFGIVAILSARIMNWKKHRLELRTEIMRNAYLVTTLFIIPYSLYQLVPSGFVSLSWIITAIIYYGLSILLQNKKYRWMALITLLFTIFYIILIGTTNLDPVFRIISFIFLGIVLIVISILYSKLKTKVAEKNSR